MHLLKAIRTITTLGSLFATAATMPATNVSVVEGALEPRDELADKTAIVNEYSGSSCGGAAFSFTQTRGANACRAVTMNTASIQVSAKYVFMISYNFIKASWSLPIRSVRDQESLADSFQWLFHEYVERE